ncbi:MAG: hypothetical protein ABIK09_21115 [Pseudomonadota bacterium]
MEQQGTCEQRLEAAFLSLAPQDLEGLGAALRRDETARRRYDRLAGVDLALAQRADAFAVLGPMEARIASSFESLTRFYSPALAGAGDPPARFARRAARWALAAAAVLLAVLLPTGMEPDRPGVEQPGIWTARGDGAAYLRPYCMDSESHVVEGAIASQGLAVCGADQYLLLTYVLRTDVGAWLHAVALPYGGDEPVWIVPNPVHVDPGWVAPADRPTEAWPTLDLSINYPTGPYQVVWAACDDPIPWTDWADAAAGGQEGIDDLLDTRRDCESGSWILVVREVVP